MLTKMQNMLTKMQDLAWNFLGFICGLVTRLFDACFRSREYRI